MLYNAAMLEAEWKNISSQGSAQTRALKDLFADQGWSVVLEPGTTGPDLLVSKGRQRYVVELKLSAEARADRVIPLLSQAILQATRHAAKSNALPLAVVQVGRLTNVLRERVSRFHADYAPQAAIGLIGTDGGRWFEGEGLGAMNAETASTVARRKNVRPKRSHDLFSDMNQWLLKVLLAPELPKHLLTAPRGDYRTATELAEAAQVSAMSVSRFIRRPNRSTCRARIRAASASRSTKYIAQSSAATTPT